MNGATIFLKCTVCSEMIGFQVMKGPSKTRILQLYIVLWIKVFEGQSSKLLKPKESRRLLLRLVSDAVWTLKNDIKTQLCVILSYEFVIIDQ